MTDHNADKKRDEVTEHPPSRVKVGAHEDYGKMMRKKLEQRRSISLLRK